MKPTINFSGEKPTFSTTCLESNADQTVTIDETFLMEKAKALQNKLMEFNVPIMIEWFDIWPSIVQIRIKPDEGIRLATIESLSNDISLSLKSKSVRIVAPIPGTGLGRYPIAKSKAYYGAFGRCTVIIRIYQWYEKIWQ